MSGLERCNRRDRGFLLLEILVVLFLFSITALAVARSTLNSIQIRNRAVHSSVAMQLAMDQMEVLSAADPSTFDDSDDFADTVARGTAVFNRAVDFTVNGDGSRTVRVTIANTNEQVGGEADIINTFAMWGTQ